MNEYEVEYTNETAAITATLESFTTYILKFEGTDSSFKVIISRINHVIVRIMRMKISDNRSCGW